MSTNILYFLQHTYRHTPWTIIVEIRLKNFPMNRRSRSRRNGRVNIRRKPRESGEPALNNVFVVNLGRKIKKVKLITRNATYTVKLNPTEIDPFPNSRLAQYLIIFLYRHAQFPVHRKIGRGKIRRKSRSAAALGSIKHRKSAYRQRKFK